MGWKHGQGIGPRVKRKQKKQSGNQSTVYGPALPSNTNSVWLHDVIFSAAANIEMELFISQMYSSFHFVVKFGGGFYYSFSLPDNFSLCSLFIYLAYCLKHQYQFYFKI